MWCYLPFPNVVVVICVDVSVDVEILVVSLVPFVLGIAVLDSFKAMVDNPAAWKNGIDV